MDPITLLGASAAATQFGSYGAKSLLSLISLVQALQDTPAHIRDLLQDVEKSIARLLQLRQALQDPNSDIMQGLEPWQIQSIQDVIDDGHSAMSTLQSMLQPLVKRQDGSLLLGAAKAWKAVIGLARTKQIEEKLQRIQRLHTDVLQQLQVTDLELQAKMSSMTLRMYSSVHETQKDIHLLDSRLALLETTSSSTHQEVRHMQDALFSLQNASLISGEKVQSGFATMQPTIDSIQEEQEMTRSRIEQVDKELRTVKEHAITSHEILMALTKREHQQASPHNDTISYLSRRDKEDIINQISRAILTSPRTLHDALGDMPPAYQPPSHDLGRSTKRTNQRARKWAKRYAIAIQFSPLLKKALVITFGLTFGSGGYSVHHSLDLFATVKRSESPLFQLFDQYYAKNWLGFSSNRRRLCILARHGIKKPRFAIVELRKLLDDLRSASISGLASLNDRDENNRTLLQDVIQLFGLFEMGDICVSEEFLLFLQLFETVHFDLSARTTFMDIASPSQIIDLKTVSHVKGLTIQEYALRCITRFRGTRKERIRNWVNESLMLPYLTKFDSEDLMEPFCSLFDKQKPLHISAWVTLFHQRPGLIELFSDSTGLGVAIVNRLTQNLVSCFKRWTSLCSRVREASESLTGDSKSASERDMNNVLWSLVTSPLELTLGWIEGTYVLLNAGAHPKDALTTAACFGDLDILQLLLNIDNMNAVTDEDIMNIFTLPSHFFTKDVVLEALRAMKLRRQRLLELALTQLPTNEVRELGLVQDILLDSKASKVYDSLLNKGIEVPRALTITYDKPIYHHWAFLQNQTMLHDLAFGIGFKEIDAEYMGRTPLQKLTEEPKDGDTLLWFLSKGARPQIQTRLKWTCGNAFTLALNLSDWFIIGNYYPYWFSHAKQSDDTACSILRLCARDCEMSVRDGCKCFCSSRGCTPIHCFRRATYHACKAPDWFPWKKGGEERELYRVPRHELDHVLEAWCYHTHRPIEEVHELYEDSCRLELFERLQMVHTCLPHGVHTHLEPPEPWSENEIQEIKEEDQDSKDQLDLLMHYYGKSRDIHLPHSPRLSDYVEHLAEWWKAVDAILPEIDYGIDREEQIREALESAGYLEELDETEGSQPESIGSTRVDEVEIPNFLNIIQHHFTGYL
ncbi:hypothetical protein F5Y19DRAFT_449398, partial [Xylariaceae sp. FL1651]